MELRRGELAERIRALRDAGVKQADIARQLNCNYSYVHDVYHSTGRRTTHGGGHQTLREVHQMCTQILTLLRKLAKDPGVIEQRLAELDSKATPRSS